jgi:molybdopterin converting factor subunit 1
VRVEVRYFASLADRAGAAAETVEIDGACDVEALWQALVARHPELKQMGYRPLVACDMEYSGWDRRLEGVREVAFLPPVSGGWCRESGKRCTIPAPLRRHLAPASRQAGDVLPEERARRRVE